MPLDIDRDSARETAQNELAKPIYTKESVVEWLVEWGRSILHRLIRDAASVTGGWFTISVVVIITVVVLVVTVRIVQRTLRTNRGSEYEPLGASEVSAAEHRATAQRFATQGNWAAAIRYRVRAIDRQLEEDAVLDDVPGRTATEFARDAGAAIPHQSADFLTAANTFNDVTYGGRAGSESAYLRTAALDEQLRSRRSAPATPQSQPGITDPWAAVR